MRIVNGPSRMRMLRAPAIAPASTGSRGERMCNAAAGWPRRATLRFAGSARLRKHSTAPARAARRRQRVRNEPWRTAALPRQRACRGSARRERRCPRHRFLREARRPLGLREAGSLGGTVPRGAQPVPGEFARSARDHDAAGASAGPAAQVRRRPGDARAHRARSSSASMRACGFATCSSAAARTTRPARRPRPFRCSARQPRWPRARHATATSTTRSTRSTCWASPRRSPSASTGT